MATWLAITAKRFGYPADLLPHSKNTTTNIPQSNTKSGTRLKGKARKAAQMQKGNVSVSDKKSDAEITPNVYVIDVKDFIALAEFIASSKKPKAKVPRVFVRALDRAIKLRKDHGLRSSAKDNQEVTS